MARLVFAVVCIVFLFAAAAVGSPAPAAKSKVFVSKSDMVTYVGCLRTEDHGQRFLLTDITGPNAPRARSWKTVFITTHEVDMTVVPARGIRLREHVGKLVRITGHRDKRNVRANKLSYAGASCS